MKALLAAVLVATMAAPGFAQQQPMLLAVPVSAGAVLPKNTQVVLSLNEALSTRSKRQKQGDSFDLTVARNDHISPEHHISRNSQIEGVALLLALRSGR